MAITAAEIETLIDAANSAAESGDHATALAKLRQAKALISALPDSSRAGDELSWDRAALDLLIGEYRREAAAASGNTQSAGDGAGVQRSKITYKRADGTEW